MSTEILEQPSVKTSRRARGGVVRLSDVAQHLGVHPMTVSRALSGNGGISEATRATVIKAAAELGYRPNVAARSLRRGHNPRLVALFAGYLDSGKNTQKLEAIQNLLGSHGYETPIYACGFHNQTGPLQTEMLAGLRTQRPAAIVCNSLLLTAPARAELLSWIEEGGNTVLYDHDLDVPCDRVVFDREHSGQCAVAHLLELGHRRIGYAHHSPVYGGDDRLHGVQDRLLQEGLLLPEQWVLRADEPTDAVAGGLELARQFLSLPVAERPTALAVVNDLAAMSFIAALNARGLSVPQDLSIVAFDDQPFSAFASVPLTTITHPATEIARHVVDLLLARLNQENDAPRRRVVVRGELIVRASAALL